MLFIYSNGVYVIDVNKYSDNYKKELFRSVWDSEKIEKLSELEIKAACIIQNWINSLVDQYSQEGAKNLPRVQCLVSACNFGAAFGNGRCLETKDKDVKVIVIGKAFLSAISEGQESASKDEWMHCFDNQIWSAIGPNLRFTPSFCRMIEDLIVNPSLRLSMQVSHQEWIKDIIEDMPNASITISNLSDRELMQRYLESQIPKKSLDAVQSVMAHELGHAVLRHEEGANRKMSLANTLQKTLLVAGVLSFGAAALFSDNSYYIASVLSGTLSGVITTLCLALVPVIGAAKAQISKRMELEADEFSNTLFKVSQEYVNDRAAITIEVLIGQEMSKRSTGRKLLASVFNRIQRASLSLVQRFFPRVCANENIAPDGFNEYSFLPHLCPITRLRKIETWATEARDPTSRYQSLEAAIQSMQTE